MVSAELSLYPLTQDYSEPVVRFIQLLRSQAGIEVATNGLSTQLVGTYDDVMAALTVAMRPTIEGRATCSFVIKLLNVRVVPGKSLGVD